MIFNELLIYCKVQAIQDRLSPTEEAVWRSLTRTYSERWHVPLPLVRQMDPEEVIREVLDAKYEDTDVFDEIEGLLEDIYKIENPDYVKEQEADMNVFITGLEKREKKRIKTERQKQEKREKNLRQEPKRAGSVDFSKLESDDDK